jgi:hypothetical protein
MSDQPKKAASPQIKIREEAPKSKSSRKPAKQSRMHYHIAGSFLGFLTALLLLWLTVTFQPNLFAKRDADKPAAQKDETDHSAPKDEKATPPGLLPPGQEAPEKLQPRRPAGADDAKQALKDNPQDGPPRVPPKGREESPLGIPGDAKESSEPAAPPPDLPPIGEAASSDESKLKNGAEATPIDAPNEAANAEAARIDAPVLSNELRGRFPEFRDEFLKKFGGNAQSERAVQQALNWLAKHQLPDGGWSFDHTDGPGDRSSLNPGRMTDARNAATAMALLPFLGAGHTPNRGSYKDVVDRGLKFLERRGRRNGNGMSFFEPSSGTMYSHGLCSLVFCETYAMTGDKKLGKIAQECIDFIEWFQDKQGGGWRYDPQQPGDTSILGWQLAALKTAEQANLKVKKETLRLATRFLDSVATKSGAWYGYTGPPSSDSPEPAPTAIGLYGRLFLGWGPNHPSIKEGVAWLATLGPVLRTQRNPVGVNMYHNYYAAQVLKQIGGPSWDKWNTEFRDFLTRSMNTVGPENGSWFFDSGNDLGTETGGRLYYTSLCCLSLEVYYRQVPKAQAVRNKPEVVLEMQPQPDAVQLDVVRTELRELFPEPYKVLEKKSSLKVDELQQVREFSDRLFVLAQEEKEPAKKFGLFEQAFLAALYHERPEESESILNRWSEQFSFDKLSYEKQACRTWLSLINQANSDVEARRAVRRELLQMVLNLEQEYQKKESWPDCEELLELATSIAGQVGDQSLEKQMKNRRDEFVRIRTETEAYRAARSTLESNPEDSEANTIAARFEIEVKRDWARGLRFLKFSAPGPLRELAELELQEQPNPTQLAEKWLDAAKAGSQLLSTPSMAQRAVHWFERAEAGLSGLEREKVRLKAREAKELLTSEQ